VPRDLAGSLGLSPFEVKRYFGDLPELAVVKCVDPVGERLTAITSPHYFKALLASGEAGDPQGMDVVPNRWPVIFRGWLAPGQLNVA
jgi:hypothetical protein